MKEFSMYSRIKDLEHKGFTERQTARILKINRKTVGKYRAMSLDEYMDYLTTNHKLSSLDEIRPVILDWLRSFPSMTTAQIHDWILESYPSRGSSERSQSAGMSPTSDRITGFPYQRLARTMRQWANSQGVIRCN